MKAEPAVFESAFFPGKQVQQHSSTIILRQQLLGNLPVSSGQLVATDPITLSAQTPCFTTQFLRGRFPVELAIARFTSDERVAFAHVLFSAKPLARWELAVLPGQSPLPVRGPEYYGYLVDGGMALFLDAADVNRFSHFMADEAAAKNLMITCFHLDSAVPVPGFLYATSHDTLAAFSTGFGDGSYATYVGLDAENQPCRLLTDFQVLAWQ
ncbi:hypothetical protein Hsw_4025 [Hymenobacter swuensis DY53]|uniref:DUF4241 domain-containing protein n=1 Tax=Hymenobacter swuensis DY53 TaxID=1227739 RepID=W8FD44_9BACT|nr:hypothetical protein Hsw_4025 [Hymenobacter swuensis DY53]